GSIITSYLVRWSCITEARLRLKQNSLAEALEYIAHVEDQTRTIRDIPFSAALRLLRAQALSGNNPSAAAAQLLQADMLGATTIREIQAQYYSTAEFLLRSDNLELSKVHGSRARRLWVSQGVVSMRLEMCGTAF